MIKYSLECRSSDCGEQFESWFSNGSDYDRLKKSDLLSCPSCSSPDVSKALMAPMVSRPITDPQSQGIEMQRSLRRNIERAGQNMGVDFVSEARRIHSGDAPDRLIYGSGSPDEVRELRDEGIDVTEIPWVPLYDA